MNSEIKYVLRQPQPPKKPSQMEYRHYWRPSAKAWYVRLYVWTWMADVKKLDFCKFFWGYVFFLPFIIPRLFIMLLDFVNNVTAPGRKSRKQRRKARIEKVALELAENPPEPKPPREHPNIKRALEGIAFLGAKFIFTIDRTKALIERTNLMRYVYIAAMSFMVVFVAAVTAGIAYVSVVDWSTAKWVYGIAGALLVVALLGLGLMMVIEASGLADWFAAQMAKAEEDSMRVRMTRQPKRVKQGFKDFGHMLKLGYYAVKTNTCPKVEVKN